MKNLFSSILLITALALAPRVTVSAETEPWPKVIQSDKATVTIYQPQPESFKGNILKSRAAVSVKTPSLKEPVFGVVWSTATVNTDRETRIATLETLKVTDVRFPNNPDSAKVNKLKQIIEEDSKNWNLKISLDELAASLEEAEDAQALQDNINTKPPKIFYQSEPTMLVIIDGEPKMDDIEKSKLKRVVNTPFGIFYDGASKTYYLNGNGIWYEATELKGAWKQNNKLTGEMKALADELVKKGSIPNPDTVDLSFVPKVIVSTEPAELIQTNGKPDFETIKGTNLLYASNSESQIFMDVTSQKYYILVTGRWYTSGSLENGPWTYVASDKLPADFAKIPVGTEKDVVLSSVAGTSQAEDAVKDAMIPQTASVDRKTATTTVTYDGDPKFSKVSGTDELYYAENSEQTVLKDDGSKKYYCVDEGVWYESSSPNGPWKVCDKRPDEVDEINSESPVYNVKYVYIYDATPEVVYVGYTPGYTGCYIYGPTVVYGTGYYYNPWYGAMYYPRPYTYGFNMSYNPWTGWSFGFSMSYGWFNFSYGWGGYGYGGWWGPPVYRPPYYPHYNHYYGARSLNQVNHYNINNNYYGRGSNYDRPNSGGGGRGGGSVSTLPAGGNMYGNKRPGVSTGSPSRPGASQGGANRPAQGGGNTTGTRPGANTGGSANTRPGANNVYSDKQGNVYKNNGSNWQQYDGQKFQNTNKTPSGGQNANRPAQGQNQNSGGINNSGTRPSGGGNNQQQLNQSKQYRNEGANRTQNYNNYRSSGGSYGGARPSGGAGGGARVGGGGGGPRR